MRPDDASAQPREALIVTAEFLGGVLSAWAGAQVAVGAFFLMVQRVGRRQGEYPLFGGLCFLLAVTTGSIAYLYAAGDFENLVAIRIANGAAILAAPVNLHFVYRYIQVPRRKLMFVSFYALAACFEIANFTIWWGDAAMFPINVGILQGVGTANVASAPLAYSFALLALGQLLLGAWLLLSRWRRGHPEALSALLGTSVLIVAVVNDAAIITGVVVESTYLVPHAFLAYAFGVATTLIYGYRAATGELADTAVQLEQSSKDLRRSYAELKVVQDELVKRQQLAAVGELAAVIAHEVRNPLAIIVNAVAALRRPRISESDRQTLLGIVEEETARLNRLVTDLLRYARPITLKKTAISLSDLARRVPAMDKYDCTLEFKLAPDPELETIWVDPTLFRVVFDNLVDNACQSMPGGGKVQIHVTRKAGAGGDFVQIEIRDSGRGMEPETLRRAGDPFFTTRPSGTGLGLPIVERIIEAHEGEIRIESELALGTKVTVLIPLGAPTGVSGSLSFGVQ